MFEVVFSLALRMVHLQYAYHNAKDDVNHMNYPPVTGGAWDSETAMYMI